MGLFNFITEIFSDTYTDQNGYKRYKDSNKLVHRYMAEKNLDAGSEMVKLSIIKTGTSKTTQNTIFGFLKIKSNMTEPIG
jgi:hypothetical protein